MVTLKKIKIFATVDFSTTLTQLLATAISTGVSIYFHFKNRKPTDDTSYFVPAFNFLCAAFVVYTHAGQLRSVRKLVKTALDGVYDEELIDARENWGCWNGATSIASVIWYPLFAITMFYQYGWPLPYIGGSFLVIAAMRVVLTCVFYKMLVDEEDPIPPIDDILGQALEMREIRHHG